LTESNAKLKRLANVLHQEIRIDIEAGLEVGTDIEVDEEEVIVGAGVEVGIEGEEGVIAGVEAGVEIDTVGDEEVGVMIGGEEAEVGLTKGDDEVIAEVAAEVEAGVMIDEDVNKINK